MDVRVEPRRPAAGLRVQRQDCGKAVLVDTIKPTLKAPVTKRLKLNCNESLSIFAFNSNLRHYTVRVWDPTAGTELARLVGRCRSRVSNSS